MQKQKNKKLETGITLITLVVSIIVLIILAGVSIAMLVGENGIITQAQRAAQETEEAKQNEEKGLQELEGYIDSSLGGETATTVAEAKGGMRYNNTTPITDDSGDTMYIPGGFKVAEDSATDIDNGVVITDGINEFVWVPVDNDDLAEMYIVVEEPLQLTGVETTTNIYSKLRIRNSDRDTYTVGMPGSTNTREVDLLGTYDINKSYYEDILGYDSINQMANRFVEEYKATYDSVKKYQGFYIGRYELTGTPNNPTVKKDENILTNQNWYELKKACSKVISTQYAQSEMVYGNQWDEIMSWLITTGEKTDAEINEDSSSWGNYNSTEKAETSSGEKRRAGNNEAWRANNIYDLAGNCYEWTQEAMSTHYRVGRGGCYTDSGSTNTASARGYNIPIISDDIKITSRVSMYIK